MKYIIGVDGGGTKTLGYIANLEGDILGSYLSGPANYHSVGKTKSKETLEKVINALCKHQHIHIKNVDIISLGLAGVDREQDKEVMLEILKDIKNRSSLIINNDGKTSLVGASGKPEGIITICGTGSISLGIDATGKMVRAGGWGHIIGDEGSGYDFGKQALMAVAKAHDKRDGATLLTNAIMTYLGLKEVDEIIGYVYNHLNAKEKIAQLAPIVFECYERNDERAKGIINNAIDELVQMTAAVINQLSFNTEKITISLTGGIFDHVLMMREKFVHRLNDQFHNLHFQRPIFDGGIGALILGWHAMDVAVDTEKLKNQNKDVKFNV